MKTTYYKSHQLGNTGKSYTEPDALGMIWEISTYKRRGGIECSALQGQDQGGGAICYDLMSCKRHSLASAAGMATEKKVREVHEAGLLKFAEIMKAEPQGPAYIVGVGQILFSEGPWEESRRAVYEVVRPGSYKTVYLDGSRTKRDDHVREAGSAEGIGTYYKQGETISAEEVKALLIQAQESEARERAAEQAKEEKEAIERAEKIRKGAEIVKALPAGARAVIVAELHENTSDIQSDYFAHTTKQVVYLSWSGHNKDRFDEMRRAAAKFEPTQHMGPGKGSFTLRQVDENHRYTSAENEHYTSETDAQAAVTAHNADQYQGPGCTWIIEVSEIEHREKYSMGSGYYLKDGYSNSSGWAVSKEGLPELEKLQIAAAEGRYLCDQGEQPTTDPGDGHQVPAGAVQIVESPRRPGNILVIGETYPIRAKLKQLGGFWNKWEKGWEFKGNRLQEVTTALGKEEPEEPTDYSQQEATEARETQQTADAAAGACYDRDEDKPTEADRIRRAAERTGHGALLQAGRESGRVMIVTPQAPAPWSPHGATVPPQSAEARQIINEVSGIVKEAAAGKVSSAQAMEEAADKIARIDTPKATETAATLRTMAAEHRRKLSRPIATAVNSAAEYVPGSAGRPHAGGATAAGKVIQLGMF